MSEGRDVFVFNGVNGATGDYLLSPMSPARLVELALGRRPDELQREASARHESSLLMSFAPRDDVDRASLAESGWGVIFARNADDAVREALQPLLRHRAAAAGASDPGRYREFWRDDGYWPGERKAAFLRRHDAPTSGPVEPDRMPYYLLLVGGPEDIPSEFQAQLALQHAVGRLHFETLEEYDSYARSVLASERGEIQVARRLGLFGVRNDRATTLSADALIGGLARSIGARVPSWETELRAGEGATKAALAELLGGPETPAVLLTASHGVGFPKGHVLQRACQGALLCQDGAPGRGPLTPAQYFAAEDLGDSARLAGLIAFLFACYGGGTPKYDPYLHGAGKREPQAPQPFFAALPQRMLGHPRGGALAAIAHVDRAWGCSFVDRETVAPQIAVYESFLLRLLDGQPVGAAMEYFGDRQGELSAALLEKLEEVQRGGSVPPRELANDWTESNDARNFILFGDPAVRVPTVADGEAPRRPALELRAPTTQAPTTGAASSAPPPEALGMESFSWFSGDRDEPAPEGVRAQLRGFVASLGKKISDVVADMSTLEVSTYVTGDSDEVFVGEGDLIGARLRAYTRVSLDGDTVVCVPEREGELDRELLALHERMVEQALKARAEMMKTVVDAAASLMRFTK